MALINYIEPINVGNIFVGLGALIMTCVLTYLVYRGYIKFAQFFDVIINREAKYEILEECVLDKIAQEKGFDLQTELIKRQVIRQKKKSFRRKIEEQVYNELFTKKTNDKGVM